MTADPRELERQLTKLYDAPEDAPCLRSRDLNLWAAGELPLEARAEFETHLATCPECRADLAAFESAASVWETPAEPRPPAWRALLAALLSRPLPAALVAAACVCVIAGVWMWVRFPLAATPDGASARQLVPAGQRAVGVAIAGTEWLHPSDRIDVVGAEPAAHRGVTVVQNVAVLRAEAARATLLVSPAEAEALLLGERRGALRAVLRTAGDVATSHPSMLKSPLQEALRARDASARRRSTLQTSAALAPGLRGVPVRFADVSDVRPGDHVDVVATYEDPPGDGLRSGTVLSNVIVSDVAARSGSALLAVLPEEAELLTWLGDGALRLAVRGSPDADGAASGAPEGAALSTVALEPSHGWEGATFVDAAAQPVSRIPFDVDSRSLGSLALAVDRGVLPAPGTVRVEELLNAFSWSEPKSTEGPFSIHVDGAPSPFAPGRELLRVAIRDGRRQLASGAPVQLVVVVDLVARLALVQRALRMLVDELGSADTIALVSYSGVVLPPTSASRKVAVFKMIESLTPATADAVFDAPDAAFALARAGVRPGHDARVVVVHDDPYRHADAFGRLELRRRVSDPKVLISSVDVSPEAVRSNALFAAHALLAGELGIAPVEPAERPVITVDFDPREVRSYRRVGSAGGLQDRREDVVAPGRMVLAMYELELAAPPKGRVATVKVRWSDADEPVVADVGKGSFSRDFLHAPRDLRFATGVMGAAEILHGSPFAAAWSPAVVETLTCADRKIPERAEFCELWRAARTLQRAVP